MSVIMAGQPAGLQRNFGCKIGKMCDSRAKETSEHILMDCPALRYNRDFCIRYILFAMPNAMKHDYHVLDSTHRFQFLISGFNGSFTIEWIELYRRILIWVQELYTQRSRIYDQMESLPC